VTEEQEDEQNQQTSHSDKPYITNKKLCYRRGNAQLALSVEIMSTAVQLVEKITFQRLAVGE